MTTKNFVVKNGLEAGNITLDAITNIITTTGNVSAANILTGGIVSANGNITGNNLNVGNIISAGGNITGANILTIGNVSATGAVLGSNVYVSSLGSEQIAIAFTGGQLVGGPDLRWEFSNAALWATNIKSNGYISTSGNVTGANLLTSGLISTSGNLNANNLTTTGNVSSNNTTVTGVLSVSGNLDYTGANAYFSNVSNLKIPGGTANYVLTTDGTGNVSWQPTGQGNANVAGNNTEVQFNDGGTLGASANFTFNKTSNTLSATFIAGDGSNLANIAGANVTGTVANANHACTANVVTDGTQSNITAVGTLTSLSSSGNITGANLLTGGIVSANGNVAGNFILGNGFYLTGVSTNSTTILNGNSNVIVEANSNVNVSVAGNANVLVVTGTGSNVNGYLYVTGNVTGANANLGNVVNANFFIGSGNNLSNIQAANVTGTVANANYAAYAGNVVNASQPNITSVGTLSSLSVSGNANVGNLNTAIVSASGNLTAANANLGNAVNANFFIGSGNNISNIQGANVTGTVANATHASTANTVVDGNQSNITSLGTLTNLSVSGNANIGNNVNVTGNAVITGNLVVGGNTVYVNVETIRVEDPIIELGGGPNGAPLTSDDGKDRGTLLHYYAGTPIDAFIGWDASNSEFAMGSNVSITNDVITFNTFGNLRIQSLSATVGNFSGNISAGNANLGNAVTANFYFGNGYYLSGINPGNIGTVANANFAAFSGNVTVNSQPNITSVGTLTTLVVSGNANVGNLGTTGLISATGNVTGNYILGNGAFLTGIVTGTQSNIANGNSNVSIPAANGNITMSSAGNANVVVITGTGVNVAGYVSASGNVTGNYILGNGALLTGITSGVQDKIANGNSNVYIPSANGNVTITSAGNANVVIITGTGVNVAGYTNITGNLTVGNKSNLGNAGNVIITGGSNGYFLSTDGTGNLSWDAVPVTGLTVTVDDFTGNGVQTQFTLSTTPASEDFTIVSLAGTFQPRTTYSLAGNVLTFSTAPPNTAPIEVTTFGGAVAPPASYNTRTYTGNGSQTVFSITSGSTVNSLLVTENGILQTPTTDYTVSGANLTFTTAPANSVAIQVRELPTILSTGGGGLTWSIANANATMSANYGYFVDTTVGAITMTLPASATLGDTIRVNDLAGNFGSNACTIARNGHLIQGVADDLVANTAQTSFGLVYSNSTYGWKILEVI